jgi:Recombinase
MRWRLHTPEPSDDWACTSGGGKNSPKACFAKVALRAAKGRGVLLGNPNVGKMNTEAAAARDAILRPILHEMWAMPYRDIAQELTSRNIPTPRGGDLWSAMTVMRVMKRLRIAGR